jgi:hypothetical protein
MDLSDLQASATTVINVPPEKLYEFIADMPRVGEISPVCTGGEWEDDRRGVGATFIGSNTTSQRTWQARMRVTVADQSMEFAWENIGDATKPVPDDVQPAARWGYTFAAVDGGTRVDETWQMLISSAQLEALGEERLKRIPERNRTAMEATLAKLKALFEG